MVQEVRPMTSPTVPPDLGALAKYCRMEAEEVQQHTWGHLRETFFYAADAPEAAEQRERDRKADISFIERCWANSRSRLVGAVLRRDIRANEHDKALLDAIGGHMAERDRPAEELALLRSEAILPIEAESIRAERDEAVEHLDAVLRVRLEQRARYAVGGSSVRPEAFDAAERFLGRVKPERRQPPRERTTGGTMMGERVGSVIPPLTRLYEAVKRAHIIRVVNDGREVVLTSGDWNAICREFIEAARVADPDEYAAIMGQRENAPSSVTSPTTDDEDRVFPFDHSSEDFSPNVDESTETSPCQRCGGATVVDRRSEIGDGPSRYAPCPICRGSGVTPTEKAGER